MRQRDAVAERSIENGFVLPDFEFYAYRMQTNDISGRGHAASSNQGLQIFRGLMGKEPAGAGSFLVV
jgi:hypothetical protein